MTANGHRGHNLRRMKPTHLLETILRERTVQSVFQPIVEIDSDRVVAYEALARGRAPAR